MRGMRISVTNTGKLASTLQAWEIFIDGQRMPKVAFNAGDQIIITSPSPNDPSLLDSAEINLTDFITEKTFPVPIQPGGGQRGWLMTYFPSPRDPDSVRVTCADVNRRPYEFELTDVTSRGPLRVPALGYWPGVAITHREESEAALAQRTKAEEIGAQRVGANDWKQLATTFKELQIVGGFPGVQAEWSQRDGVEQWGRLGGDAVRASQCEAYCKLAGQMLVRSPRVIATLSPRVVQESDTLKRWLAFLADKHGIDHFGDVESSGDGFAKGSTEWGYVLDVPAKSANACIECAAMET